MFSMLLQYFVISFFNHFACFEAFQWTFHPYGFRGVVEGAGIFPEWEEWIGERGYCAEKWGPVVADGVNIERKVLVRIVQCWILESSSYFWSAGSLNGLRVANKSLHGFDICWWLLEEERIVTMSILVNWVSDHSEYFLGLEHFDQFLFCSGVGALPMEGWRCGVCPRRSFAGAWSRVGASGCWSSGGAAFAIFNSGFGGKYVVIFEWKT